MSPSVSRGLELVCLLATSLVQYNMVLCDAETRREGDVCEKKRELLLGTARSVRVCARAGALVVRAAGVIV